MGATRITTGGGEIAGALVCDMAGNASASATTGTESSKSCRVLDLTNVIFPQGLLFYRAYWPAYSSSEERGCATQKWTALPFPRKLSDSERTNYSARNREPQ